MLSHELRNKEKKKKKIIQKIQKLCPKEDIYSNFIFVI